MKKILSNYLEWGLQNRIFFKSWVYNFLNFSVCLLQHLIRTGIRLVLKFVFSRKATKIDKIFNVNLTVCSKCQIDGEDFVNFCGLLRKHALYLTSRLFWGKKKVFFDCQNRKMKFSASVWFRISWNLMLIWPTFSHLRAYY